MGYDYSVIQVVGWVELPEQKRLYPIFCENMDPNKWDTTVWYRVTRNPQEFCELTGCQRDPPDLGCHGLVSELRYTMLGMGLGYGISGRNSFKGRRV